MVGHSLNRFAGGLQPDFETFAIQAARLKCKADEVAAYFELYRDEPTKVELNGQPVTLPLYEVRLRQDNGVGHVHTPCDHRRP